MLQSQNFPIIKNWRLRKIAKQVRNGIVPKGVTKEKVMEALSFTRPKHFTEMFGFLSMRVFDSEGKLKQDLGLQSVKKVTTPFVKLLADAFCSSTAATGLSRFICHGVGDGSTAEASGDTLLVREAGYAGTSYARVSGSQTHGATSNIFKTVKTWGALTAFTVIEHGLFDTTATSSGNMLDRSLVTTPPTVASGDEVEFTYELTINSET